MLNSQELREYLALSPRERVASYNDDVHRAAELERRAAWKLLVDAAIDVRRVHPEACRLVLGTRADFDPDKHDMPLLAVLGESGEEDLRAAREDAAEPAEDFDETQVVRDAQQALSILGMDFFDEVFWPPSDGRHDAVVIDLPRF